MLFTAQSKVFVLFAFLRIYVRGFKGNKIVKSRFKINKVHMSF